MKHYEWYCTSCGKAGWSHDKDGKLLGECGRPHRQAACPLDLRELETKVKSGFNPFNVLKDIFFKGNN